MRTTANTCLLLDSRSSFQQTSPRWVVFDALRLQPLRSGVVYNRTNFPSRMPCLFSVSRRLDPCPLSEKVGSSKDPESQELPAPHPCLIHVIYLTLGLFCQYAARWLTLTSTERLVEELKIPQFAPYWHRISHFMVVQYRCIVRDTLQYCAKKKHSRNKNGKILYVTYDKVQYHSLLI